MIDLHTHTFLSDGALIPSELVRRAEAAGYRAIALTDHADPSNVERIIESLKRAAEFLNGAQPVRVVAGVEITHVPPARIGEMVERARELGAGIVVVHGETLVEPVATGTNLSAIEAGTDILAHPGLITPEAAALAARNGVALEITSRKGHALANGHVARAGVTAGARLVVCTDAHAPGDLIGRAFALRVARAAGLAVTEAESVLESAGAILRKKGIEVPD